MKANLNLWRIIMTQFKTITDDEYDKYKSLLNNYKDEREMLKKKLLY